MYDHLFKIPEQRERLNNFTKNGQIVAIVSFRDWVRMMSREQVELLIMAIVSVMLKYFSICFLLLS